MPVNKERIIMVQIFRFIADEEEGATALEYGLLAALIAASIVSAVTNLGNAVINAFNVINNAMANVLTGS